MGAIVLIELSRAHRCAGVTALSQLCGNWGSWPGTAVDLSIQGQGHGKDLAFDAIGRIVGAAELGGGRLIVVDAIDDTAFAFYKKLNFSPVQNNPERLYMKIATARAVLNR